MTSANKHGYGEIEKYSSLHGYVSVNIIMSGTLHHPVHNVLNCPRLSHGSEMDTKPNKNIFYSIFVSVEIVQRDYDFNTTIYSMSFT